MTKSTNRMLKDFMLFQDLNDEELRQVEEICSQRIAAKKSIIFTEGSHKEAVYFIQEGLIKTYKTDESGHEQIVSFLKAGDMFPHTGLFNANPYPATAEAIVETSLLAISVATFEGLMMQMPSIAIKMMRVMGDKIKELQDKLQMLSELDVKHRILSFLLLLAEQHGLSKAEVITINLPVTNQEFANCVGTTRESVNRLLSQLNKEGLIQVERNRIIVKDLEALKQLRETK
ncbi:Crp/Fnr family transcriptional regulator [Paenibacillus camelliae]|uniref:Crp/Fnr family transcriptional regulator n=1 Tax=Paenibacillus camelliae TaxID=512410 RepID=UPI00203BC0FB|nr:Crp/Fnr family transcriptional regulator [Paenibacillus camelliae]MCM3632757.1 Crp/Fnr family transcriptional regulator [Paenibacillus camelliae]